MSTAMCCKQTWNGRCRNWQVWDGICKNMKFRSTKVLVVQLWQFSPIRQFFVCLFLFDQLFTNMTMHNKFDCMCVVSSFLAFFFSFSQAFSYGPLLIFLIWPTSDLSHVTHFWPFFKSRLHFVFALFLHLNYQTMLYKKIYHLLWFCWNLN